jgi:hypothetical protein
MTLPRIFFSKGGWQFEGDPLPSNRLGTNSHSCSDSFIAAGDRFVPAAQRSDMYHRPPSGLLSDLVYWICV